VTPLAAEIMRRAEALGISSRELARRAGLGESTVRMMRAHQAPSVHVVVAIAKVLGTTVEELITQRPPLADGDLWDYLLVRVLDHTAIELQSRLGTSCILQRHPAAPPAEALAALQRRVHVACSRGTWRRITLAGISPVGPLRA
jgi:transcriptional regulator with XRE-family HTH domain